MDNTRMQSTENPTTFGEEADGANEQEKEKERAAVCVTLKNENKIKIKCG